MRTSFAIALVGLSAGFTGWGGHGGGLSAASEELTTAPPGAVVIDVVDIDRSRPLASNAAPIPDGQMHIALAFDKGAATTLERAVVEEAARVWAPYGILLDESPEPVSGHPAAIRLHVAMAQRPDPGTNPHSLGSILFQDGAPAPYISLYVATAADLMSTAARENPSHWPVALHNAMLSRVLGRALAHEIGHYILNEREHSKSGLMRAMHSITELMDFRGGNLELSPDDREILCDAVHSVRGEN